VLNPFQAQGALAQVVERKNAPAVGSSILIYSEILWLIAT
jgi:hypothetical protein